MRWYEYKMEVDDLHASDDLKAKLLALQANAAETPGAKSIAMPAPSPTPKKQKKPLRFPARRWAQLAACAAVCGVCLYGAVQAYEWEGVTLLGGGSSSNYSAAATKAAAPQAAVSSMEDTELDENIPAPESGNDGSVLDAVRTLPENYRNAVYLHYYEGYTAAEVGRMLGAPTNTVLSWLRRARAQLHTLLKEEIEDEVV